MADEMADVADEFAYRRSLLANLTYDEAGSRLSGFYDWLQTEDATSDLLTRLETQTRAQQLLEESGDREPPKASTPDQIAGIGCLLMKKIHEGAEPWRLAHEYAVKPPFATSSLQDHFDSVMQRFIDPALDYIERQLASEHDDDVSALLAASASDTADWYPLEIAESLKRFLKDHPDPRRNAFVMMQFGATHSHKAIVAAIRATFEKYGIVALRADDKEYHDDLFGNVLTYLHGCGFGIAVFERLEADDFNPNVSLEVGYMRALRKSVCLLKDKTLKTLHTDLVGKLYKSFDPQAPESSIPSELDKWLRDKDIITI